MRTHLRAEIRQWERARGRCSERIYSIKSTLNSFKMSRAILKFACAYTTEKPHWVNKGKSNSDERMCVCVYLCGCGWIREGDSEHSKLGVKKCLKERGEKKSSGAVYSVNTNSTQSFANCVYILACEQLSFSRMILSFPFMILAPVTSEPVSLQNVPKQCFFLDILWPFHSFVVPFPTCLKHVAGNKFTISIYC